MDRILVAVIDEDSKESIADHDLRLKNIRWHLAEGYCLRNRVG